MIIGLSGYARSGKDTVGQILIEQYGYRRVAFADKLREITLTLDPLIECDCEYEGGSTRLSEAIHQIGWEEAKEKYPEVRRLLQKMGTEVVRQNFGENAWVNLAFRDISAGERVVLTDVRFPNEAQAIREHNGIVVRINRPGIGPAGDHPSEHALKDWGFDYILQNKGNLDSLRKVVRLLMTELGIHVESL